MKHPHDAQIIDDAAVLRRFKAIHRAIEACEKDWLLLTASEKVILQEAKDGMVKVIKSRSHFPSQEAIDV